MVQAAGMLLGKKVKAFQAPSTSGSNFSLAEARGKALVLYFYPKDMTTGCAGEARDFRDLHDRFRRAGAVVLGVSRDSLKSHEKFREKEALPFHLLSDSDEKLCALFDVIREKSLYGRKYMGIARATFLADASGRIVKVWPKVKVKGHAAEVLAAVKALG